MASTGAASEAAIREQAYLLWEQEGRPDGREMEFWTRAKVAVTGKEQMDTLTKAPPKRKAKASAMGEADGAGSSATSTVRATAAKAGKAGKAGRDKPKKK